MEVHRPEDPAGFSDDECTDLAAALTYYSVLALFPALLALVSLLGLVGQRGKTDELVGVLSDMGAGSVADTIKGPVQQLTEHSSAGLVLVIGIVGALWSASGYVGAFGRAMNRVYENREGRPFCQTRSDCDDRIEHTAADQHLWEALFNPARADDAPGFSPPPRTLARALARGPATRTVDPPRGRPGRGSRPAPAVLAWR